MADLHTDTLSWARKHLEDVRTNLDAMADSAVLPDVAAIRVVLDALEAAKIERDEAQAEAVRLREALNSTNTTGRCDACSDRIQRIGDDLRPCCGCIRRRPCWHRQWRSTGCAVCIALKEPHDAS